jgi:hypothetical protein
MTGKPATSEEEQWRSLLEEHQQELGGLEHSHTARRFERTARRQERRQVRHLLDAAQLRGRAFTKGHRSSSAGFGVDSDGADSSSARSTGLGTGPRDYETSFLDIDEPGEPFSPGDGGLGHVRLSTLVFAILAIVGLVLVAVSLFVPMPALIDGIGGLFLLVGGVGLFSNLRGHKDTQTDPSDDGARV